MGYILSQVLMWDVVFEVKIKNQANIKKYKDHCEIRESKGFFSLNVLQIC